MKNGYLYLIFFALSCIVVLTIAFVFKMMGTTDTASTISFDNKENNFSLLSFEDVESFSESWINKISKKKNQQVYLYPTQKFSIEFNLDIGKNEK